MTNIMIFVFIFLAGALAFYLGHRKAMHDADMRRKNIERLRALLEAQRR